MKKVPRLFVGRLGRPTPQPAPRLPTPPHRHCPTSSAAARRHTPRRGLASTRDTRGGVCVCVSLRCSTRRSPAATSASSAPSSTSCRSRISRPHLSAAARPDLGRISARQTSARSRPDLGCSSTQLRRACTCTRFETSRRVARLLSSSPVAGRRAATGARCRRRR